MSQMNTVAALLCFIHGCFLFEKKNLATPGNAKKNIFSQIKKSRNVNKKNLAQCDLSVLSHIINTVTLRSQINGGGNIYLCW